VQLSRGGECWGGNRPLQPLPLPIGCRARRWASPGLADPCRLRPRAGWLRRGDRYVLRVTVLLAAPRWQQLLVTGVCSEQLLP